MAGPYDLEDLGLPETVELVRYEIGEVLAALRALRADTPPDSPAAAPVATITRMLLRALARAQGGEP